MEELLNNIVDEIKDINNKRELIENNKKELYRLKANKEKFRNKDNSLNPQLKAVYENVTKQMAELLRQNRNLNKEIRETRKQIVDKFTSEIETKKEKIENNKTELHRLRSNKEKLRNKDNSLKPELKKVQDDITKNMRNLLKENRKLNADIKKLDGIIVDFKENNFDKYLDNKAESQKVEDTNNQNTIKQVESTIKVEEKPIDRTINTENEEVSDKEIDEYYKKQEENSKKKIEADNKKMDRANKKKKRDDEKIEKFYDEEAKKQIGEYEKELDNAEEEELKRAIESVKEQDQKVIDDFYKQLEYAKQHSEKNEYEFGYTSKETIESAQEKILDEQAKKEIEEYERAIDNAEEEELNKAVESVKKAREEAKTQEYKQPDIEETEQPEVKEISQDTENELETKVEDIPEQPENTEDPQEVENETENQEENNQEQAKNIEDTDDSYYLSNATLKDLEGEYEVDADILNSRYKENDDKIIEKISMAIEENAVTINKQDAKEMLKKAPKNIKQEFLKFINNGVRFDGNIALGLLDNETQLFKYLEICEKYDDLSLIGSENAKARAELAEFLPQVEYLFKGLRKSDIEWPRKIKIYQNAKLTQKMYKEFGRGKDVKIKMNIFDKIYFGIASIMESGTKRQETLPSGETPREEQASTDNNHNGLAEKIANSIIEQEKRDKFAEKMAQQIEKNEEEEVNARREKLAKRMADIIEETDSNDGQNKDTDNVR